MKVLVVEDDVSIRTMLRVALSLEDDFDEIREARDGLEAVRVCETFRPDVVVIDFAMPRMDGAETAALIREIHPMTRIVVFSAIVHETPEWADACVVKGSATDLRALISSARDVA